MIKRNISVILVFAFVIMVLTCACNTSEAESAYKPPAKVYDIEIEGTGEPKIDGVEITYDKKARIDTVSYTVDGYDYKQHYSYENDRIVIKTVYMTEIIEEKVIQYVDMLIKSGFTTIDGYYVRVTDDISDSISAAKNGDHFSEQDQQTQSSADWKKLYRDYLEEFMNREDLYISQYKDSLEYSMIYVDYDDIPELFITGSGHVVSAGSVFCWIDNGSVSEQDSMSSVLYIEKTGLMRKDSGWTGKVSVTIYSLSSGKLNTVAYGNASIPTDQYSWNDIEVSESEYYSKSSEYFNESQSKNAAKNTYSYSQIMDILN
jgi:hypothetical protein